MLSVQPLKSAKSACDYYHQAFNYYQGDSTATVWLGKARDFLQLKEEVSKDEMLDLLEGKLPNGVQLKNFQGEHRPGFDMTFSAPKSLSVLVGLDIAPELTQFHDSAVKYALSQIETEFAEARVSRNGEVHYEKTGNLLVAAFRQASSRANDPALHTHCVTLNLTFLNGKAKSLASDKQRINGVLEQIQNNAHYCGLIYRQHLANSLKDAGFSLRLTGDGLFEIDGVPDDVLQAFSRRRGAIEELMQEKGWEGAELASKATLMTRQNKEEHDLSILKQEWKTRAQTLGFDANTFVTHQCQPEPAYSLLSNVKDKLRSFFNKNAEQTIPSEQEAALACVHVAVETLSQRTAVFSERMLRSESMKHSLLHEQPVTLQAIEEAIRHQKTQDHLYEAQCPATKQTLLTTPWLLTLEAESITRIENNKGMVKPISNATTVKAFQKSIDETNTHPLTNSQKQAMQLIITTKDRYLAVQGYAGVAKTTMLAEARKLIEQSGYQIRGITVASSAANELQTKAGIRADVFPVAHQELKNAKVGSLSKTVFIVDEASMLSSAQGHELIKKIEQTNARLILVGDKAQLPSVNSGRIFSLAQEYDINTAMMNEIVRQKNPKALEAVVHATKGEVQEAIDKLAHVEELSTYDERIQWMAKRWLSLGIGEREQTLLFAPTHANRADITAIIRQHLENEGTLKGDAHMQPVLKSKSIEAVQQRFASYYQGGDVLRFNQDIPQNKLKRGCYYRVGSLTKKHRQDNLLPLVDDNGKTYLFALKHLPQYKTHTAVFERVLEVYHSQNLPLNEGDKVLWCRNFKSDNIRNGQRATIQSIRDKSLVFKLDDGQLLTLDKDHAALRHLDYGYVLTNYKVQGRDAANGIGLMESHHRFSATLKNFYVQISRGVYGMTLVTDDRTRLKQAIERNSDEKKASLDMVSGKQLIAHELKFKSKYQFSIQPTIDKKLEREMMTQELSFNKQAAESIRQHQRIKELER